MVIGANTTGGSPGAEANWFEMRASLGHSWHRGGNEVWVRAEQQPRRGDESTSGAALAPTFSVPLPRQASMKSPGSVPSSLRRPLRLRQS